MAALPNAVTSIAYRARNGELAWRRVDVPAALAAIAASGHAVLGGEVWVTLGDGLWTGLVPDRNGGLDRVWAWDIGPRSQGETWRDYCDRSARESQRHLDGLHVEADAAPSALSMLYFNLTYIPKPDS